MLGKWKIRWKLLHAIYTCRHSLRPLHHHRHRHGHAIVSVTPLPQPPPLRQLQKQFCSGCSYIGGCQNYGPFLGPYYNTAPNIQGTQKGIIILTTTHINARSKLLVRGRSDIGVSLCKLQPGSLPPRPKLNPTLPETNMETQKGPYKDYSPSKRGLYGFPC